MKQGLTNAQLCADFHQIDESIRVLPFFLSISVTYEEHFCEKKVDRASISPLIFDPLESCSNSPPPLIRITSPKTSLPSLKIHYEVLC